MILTGLQDPEGTESQEPEGATRKDDREGGRAEPVPRKPAVVTSSKQTIHG